MVLPTPSGKLFVVATPIGNLQDITLRALKVLAEVALVAAEDTRHTQKLLSFHGIRARLFSYREQNHARAAAHLLAFLREGNDVALVTDAGTPVLSDPGGRLVEGMVGAGIQVVPIPGPSALISAVSVSGLAAEHFAFLGFLPRKPGALRRLIEALSSFPGSLVFYESPQRLSDSLGVLERVLGPRRAVVARELTKLHETLDRGTLQELAEGYSKGTRGEVTVVVEGARDCPSDLSAEWQTLLTAIARASQLSPGHIAELLEPLCKAGKRDLYQRVVAARADPNP